MGIGRGCVFMTDRLVCLAGKSFLGVLVAAVLLSGCSVLETSDVGNRATDTKSKAAPQSPRLKPASINDASFLITPTGIGAAQLGWTFADMKKGIAGVSAEHEPFLVDFAAIPVRRDDEVHLYIVYEENAPPQDTDIVTMLSTNHPSFRTSEGVGPGISINDAISVYGEAEFVYNVDNESREYVTFANGPAGRIWFRPRRRSSELDYAGIYSSATDGSIFRTTRYHDDAVIEWVDINQ